MRNGVRLVLSALALAATLPLVLRADPGQPSIIAEIQLQLGDLLFKEARYAEAADAYDRARNVSDPVTGTRASSGLVKSLLRMADFPRARAEAERLIAFAPLNGDALSLYGDTVWAAALFEEAERAYRDALAIDARSSRGHHGLARTLAAKNRLGDALGEAQAALSIEPREGEYHHTVGEIYERMRRYEEAAAAFGNYVGLLPNRDRSDKALWARAEIRFLQSFERRVPLEIDADSPSMLHTLPFKLARDKVIVQGRVNGGGNIDFVLDTGAEQTVLSRTIARRAGVAPVTYIQTAGVGEIGLRGLQVGRIDSLQFGSLKIRNVPCLIKNPPLEQLPTREMESFSPLVLGLSMVIDYERRLLTIGRVMPEDSYDTELPLRLYRLAMVRGTVNNTFPASFVVDTGGEVISISQDTAGALQADPTTRRIPLRVYGTSGWDRDAFLMPNVDLSFAGIRFSKIPVVVLNLRAPSVLLGFQVGGIIGHRFLSKYRVAIDIDRSVVRLKTL